jgi:hypothetical protein
MPTQCSPWCYTVAVIVESGRCEILGIAEIAELLKVKPRTPHLWKYRGQLPEPDFESVNGCSAWHRDTILLWASETGRLPEELEPEVEALRAAR